MLQGGLEVGDYAFQDGLIFSNVKVTGNSNSSCEVIYPAAR